MSITTPNENFRDSISTIDEKGKRQWIFPKKPKGKFYNYRKIVSYTLLLFLIVAPFIKIQGNQFLLFNIIERKFNIFSFPFWPQDFYLLVFSMIMGVVFITLFTVAFGRIFCGWICPQTIFMEFVFRRIEYWIEGDRGAQIRLSKQQWNTEKLLKKGVKHLLFFIISFFIANIFLAYFIGSDQLMGYIYDGPKKHLGTLVSLLIFTSIFYFVFSWFREQVCVIACPYGRLQSVLLDNKSVVVAYDHKRGEGKSGRKKIRKNEDRLALGHGDCIDCFQCVHVCPTGIDIRNGTQLECVNCTACIDACDDIMEKVNLPKGLIRYASEDEIVKGTPFKFTIRMKSYSVVLLLLIGVFATMLTQRNDVEANILRIRGQLYQSTEDGKVSNVYHYKIVNKTSEEIENASLHLSNSKGTVKLVSTQQTFTIPKQGLAEGTLFIELPKSELKKDKTTLRIEVFANHKAIETTKVSFIGPRTYYN